MRTPLPWSSLVAAGAIGAAAIILRLAWDRYLDPFEDGYQNWWISSILVDTGRLEDPYGGMTRGNWLPGYHMIGAVLVSVLGDHPIIVMKAANIALSLGTAVVVFLLARPRGRAVAWLAATLFALNPADIVIASFATPESATLLAVFSGVLLLERRRPGDARTLAAASLCFLLAATLRYEAWAFILFYLIWARARRGLDDSEFLAVIGPALGFAVAWLAWTSQNGFLPSLVFSQTSADVRYKEAAGSLAPLGQRLLAFFAWYVGWTPLAMVAFAWGFLRERGSSLTWILTLFYAGEVAYTAAGLGNPGPRYIHLTIPVVCIFSAAPLVAAGRWLAARRPFRSGLGSQAASPAARSPRAHPPASRIPAAAALAISVVLAILIITPQPEPGTMLRGTERAGLFLSDRPLPEPRLLYSESPIAAYYSGYPAPRMIGPATLPSDPAAAEAFLVDKVAYVVMVTVPYLRMRTLFPDLAEGADGHHLRLLYDATGPEYELGAPRVLVFEVVPECL